MCVVQGILGGFRQELQSAVVAEQHSFVLTFATSKKPPDFTQKTLNDSDVRLVASGVVRTAATDSGCEFLISQVPGSGTNVTMSCEAAQPHHAGTYIGTDNDDAESAQKTEADVIVVSGTIKLPLQSSCRITYLQLIITPNVNRRSRSIAP